jgi:hypothetical protein
MPTPKKEVKQDGVKIEYHQTEIQNFLYTIPIHAISRSKTGRFATPNRPFRTLKRAVSQRQKGHISNRLITNE